MMKTTAFFRWTVGLLMGFAASGAFAANVSWTGGGDGANWHNGANWSGGVVPPAGSDVTISVPASNPTILFTSSAGTVQINSLTTSELMTISGGTLQVATAIQTTANMTLSSSGIIKNGTLGASGGAVLTASAGTLDGVTLASDLVLTGSMTVKNGLTLANNAKITFAAVLDWHTQHIRFEGTQTLGGVGEVLFSGVSNGIELQARGDGTQAGAAVLTIGPGITVHGTQKGRITNSFTYDSIVNQGTISADTSGMTITVLGATVTNQGTMQAINGGSLDVTNLSNPGSLSATGSTLTLNGTWSNTGTINVANSTLNLGGSYTLASMGTINRTGGSVNITGTLNNTGTTLVLNAVSGSWNLGSGGTILGGTVGASGGAVLTASAGTLDGVTLASDLVLTGSMTVKNGLTLANNAKIMFAAVLDWHTQHIRFEGTQTLGGVGEVLFSGVSNGIELQARGDGTQAGAAVLTIGPGITVHGTQKGGITNSFTYDSIVNLGTINANVSGKSILINSNGMGTFTNQGSIGASNGGQLYVYKISGNLGVTTLAGTGSVLSVESGSYVNNLGLTAPAGTTLTLYGAWTNPAGATISATGGTLNLGGSGAWTNAGTISVTNTTVNLGGAFTLATLGTFNRVGGTININGLLNNTGAPTYLANQSYNSSPNDAFDENPDTYWSAPGYTGTLEAYFPITIRLDRINLSVNAYPSTTETYTIYGSLDGLSYTQLAQSSQNVTQGGIRVLSPITFPEAEVKYLRISINGNASWVGVNEVELMLVGSKVSAVRPGPADIVTLDATTGSWNLAGGSMMGGAVNMSGGSKLVFTSTGGTLDGVVVNGDMDLTANNAYVNVINGLTLNGTATLGYQGRLRFNNGSQTLDGNGTVVFNDAFAQGLQANANNMVLTIGAGITVRGGNSYINSTRDSAFIGYSDFHGGGTNTSVVNLGTINADVSGKSMVINPNGTGTFTNQGSIGASNGGRLYMVATTMGSQATLVQSANGLMQFRGSLVGSTTAMLLSNPQGTTNLFGTGTVGNPQLLEVMSKDLGNVAAGFTQNFVFGTLALGNNTYARLVDQSDNMAGAGAECVYANSIIVPTGCTLDLNGLNVYARGLQQSGTVLNGTISQIPDSGPLALGSPAPGNLSAAGELDEWTFYGRAGKTMSILVNPGSSGSPAPVSPQLLWANLQLLDASDNVLANNANTTSGALVSLSNILLPADGTYKIRVKAPAGHTSSTGNYIVSAWDVTPNVRSLSIGQQSTGTIATPFALDQWIFTGTAGQQIQFDLLAATNSGLAFKLTGPGNSTLFQDITGDSVLINLPSSGNYVLSAYGLNGATGSYSFVVKQTSVTGSTPGTPYVGTWAGSGQAQLFTMEVTGNNPLSVVLSDLAAANHSELYLSFGSAPTRQTFDYAANSAGSSQSLLVPSATAGTWYVLVYGASIPSNSGTYTLQAYSSEIVLTGSSPNQSGTGIETTLTVRGAGFNSGSTVSLVSGGGTVYPAASSSTDLPTQITATFNAGAVPAGSYAIRVTQATGTTAQLNNALTMVQNGEPVLTTSIDVPSPLGRHMTATIYVNYANTGTAPMPAPLLMLTARNPAGQQGAFLTLDSALVSSGFWTSAYPAGYANTVHILANGSTPGVLQPGESKKVPVYYAGWLQSQWDFSNSALNFSLTTTKTTDSAVVDWASMEASTRPANIPSGAWHVMYTALSAQLGTTTGGFVQMLDNIASYLARLGQNVTDVNKLWGFAVAQTENSWPIPSIGSTVDDSMPMPGAFSLSFDRTFDQSIPGRFRAGPLGLGWYTSWQQRLSVSADGTVTLTTGSGVQRVFQPDSRYSGKYFSQTGDRSTLTAAGSGHQLTTVNGGITAFNGDGTFGYVQDTNGNRITAGYASGKLTSLTASSGVSFTLAYNAAGLISTLTDSAGRVTTYAYDASYEHLSSVTFWNGRVTSYTYNTSLGSPAQNAITSITAPDGTHQYFVYDSQGRFASTSADGGAQAQTFNYSAGQVCVTNAVGNTTSLYFDQNAQVAKAVDALGNPTYLTHDSNFNLVLVTNALGASSRASYNSLGKVTASTDFLGNSTHFVYGGARNQLSALTDARGNTTLYSYNAAGNLMGTTYANGKTDTFTRDPLGNALSFVNAAGEPIQYTYNAAGHPTSAAFSGGATFTYVYDNQDRLTTATDASGVVTFTYHPTTGYLTHAEYPNNKLLTFTYDAGGRRTSMVDQSGFTVNYTYDAVGRLASLKDGSNVTIVSYFYNAAGQLSQKTNANGTYTTYEYDPNGRVLHLINYAPGGTINSRFDDTFNAVGLKSSEATLDGLWTYTYDGNGQLIRAIFASNNTAVIPNQDLVYHYDPLGNRTSTVTNGLTTTYVANNMNQYSSVGGTAFSYDAKGNLLSDGTNTFAYNVLNKLVSSTGPSGTSTYTYNGLGYRVASISSGQTTQYLTDPAGLGNVVGTYDGSGGLIAHFTHGLGLVNQASAATFFYDFDPLGSTAGMSNSAGSYANQYGYLPFGGALNSTGTVPNPFQFVGQYGVQADAAGLAHMRARNYSVETGRFVHADPLGLAGGSINLYAYTGNNTTMRIDPLGLFDESIEEFGMGNPLGAILEREFAGLSSLTADDVIGEYHAGGFLDSGPVNGTSVGCGSLGTQFIPDWALWANARHACDLHDQCYRNPNASRLGCDLAINENIVRDNWKNPLAYFVVGPAFSGVLILAGGEAFKKAQADADSATQTVNATDPNAIYGPGGYGSANYVRGSSSNFGYRITYENDEAATAPAQLVTVTQNLDADLTWGTVELTGIGFGDVILTIPAGSQYYSKTVSMTYNNETFDVEIEAGVDTGTGQVYARFQSLNPTTGLPPSNPLSGFLPPEDGTGRGEGFLTYTVAPKPNLATNTEIRGVATIIFDAGEVIRTNQVDPHDPTQGTDANLEALVTIDASVPTSQMVALPSTTMPTFNVSWTGNDTGSGVGKYTVFVSTNGGAYEPWLTDTTETTVTYYGENNTNYSFYVVAKDNVGHVQQVAPGAGAVSTLAIDHGTISVEHPAGTLLTSGGAPIIFGTAATGASAQRTFTIKNTGAGSLTLNTITIGGANAADFAVTTAPVSPVIPAGSSLVVTFTPGGLGTRSAVLHIPSNDVDHTPFDINLTGTGAAPSPKAQIISPVNGTTLTSTSLPLVWNAGVGVTSYYLYVGTTVGGKEIYSGSQGTALNRTVTVPANGGKIYVTLWSLINGAWQSNTYLYTAPAPVRATLTSPSPANGSTLSGGTLNLAWNAGLGVSAYSIYVGSTVGGRDIATRNVSAATTTQSIPVPQDGGPIYVTLWSQINGAWQSESYWFLTALPLSGNVAARLTSPPNTTTLGATTATFNWDAGTGVTRRDLWIGSTPDGYDLYKGANEAALTRTLNNLPGDGRRIYATLHSLISGVWQSNAYYFTAVTSPPPQAAQLASPANGSTLANASLPLTWSAAAGATRYDLYLGSTPMAYDLYKGTEGLNTARTVTVPTDGRPIYLTLWTQVSGKWLQNTYHFTAANTAVGNQRARMTSPANGSVLPGTTATFDWNTGTGVTSYSLYVGTTPGGRELYSATHNSIRSRTLTTLPTDGRKIYVTLWSQLGAAWQSNSYLYTAANITGVKAAMLTPAPGSTFTSATVTFTWNAGTGTQYWLQVGRTPGSSNLYSGNQGTSLSKTLTTMPTDGSPIYVKLQSLINGVWQTNEYIYQAALPP